MIPREAEKDVYLQAEKMPGGDGGRIGVLCP